MEIECIKESAFNKEKSFKIAFNEILKINNRKHENISTIYYIIFYINCIDQW